MWAVNVDALDAAVAMAPPPFDSFARYRTRRIVLFRGFSLSLALYLPSLLDGKCTVLSSSSISPFLHFCRLFCCSFCIFRLLSHVSHLSLSLVCSLFATTTNSLLEGGRGGPFYEQIVDYFYYCQLRAQGEDTAETRHIRYAEQRERERERERE